MGIIGLTTFINKNFTGWKVANFEDWDHVVIDGNSVLYTLYRQNFPWALGGEYDKFSAKIEEFFAKTGFRNPIVVFDGTNDPSKMATIRKRRQEGMTEMQDKQSQSSWPTGDKDTYKIIPTLVLATFLATLKKMCVELIIVDGEADREVAALANHHKCPVLGSDSDFFIFNLTHGFVHLDRLYRDGNAKALFYIRDFMQQFRLSRYELCLMIPVYFGNDFINQKYGRYYNYDRFISSLPRCNLTIVEGVTVDRREYESVKHFYSDLKWPVEGPSRPANVPDWAYASYRKGKFPIQVFDACLNGAYVLPRAVEAIKYESPWKISQRIRQQLYYIMSLPKVKETLRMDFRVVLTDVIVPAVCTNPSVSIKDEPFHTRDVDSLSNLVLSVLLLPQDIKSELLKIQDEWKLPIAATFYWYQNLDDPPSYRNIVMALLVSFLMCYGNLPKVDFPFERVHPSTKDQHLRALHAFAQWQCVYHDAMSLNLLAREPFLTTNPASLYAGRVAMHYALASNHEGWLNRVIDRSSFKAWRLFNDLLYLVTGCDEEGRRRKHARH